MEATTITEKGISIWDSWTKMWNGELQKADTIIEEGFVPNLLNNPPFEITNTSTVKKWVELVRSSFELIEYETLAGPFIDEKQSVLACHWKATGVFSGKTTITGDKAGEPFLIEGTDILKFKGDKIYECWTQSNVVTRD